MSRKTIYVFIGFMSLLVLIFSALGIWQVKRLAWKNNLVASYTELYQAPASALSVTDLEAADPAKPLRGILDGTIAATPLFTLNHAKDGVPGVDIYGWFIPQNSERGIFVRLGWMARESDGTVQLPEIAYQTLALSGVWTELQANRYVPENQIEKKIWYRAKVSDWEKAYDLEAYGPQIFAADIITPPLEVSKLEMLPSRPVLRNNHKQYALFWFSLAGVTVLMSFFFLRSQKP